MAFEAEALKSIGGLKQGRIPLCVRPVLTQRSGSGDLTSNSGTFFFTTVTQVELSDFSHPIHFSQTWSTNNSDTGTTWPDAAKWNDIMIFKMKNRNNPDGHYGLVIQLGIWELLPERNILEFGVRGMIRNLDDDTVVKNLPNQLSPQAQQQNDRFGTPDGIYMCPQVVEFEGVNYLTFTTYTNAAATSPTIAVISSGFSINIDDPSVWCPANFEPGDWMSDDPNDDDEGEDEEDEEGGGHVRHWDPVPYPPLPTIGISTGGFVTPYNLTPAEMGTFAGQCFDADVWQALANHFRDPMDFIAGCLLVPFNPPATYMWKPKFGLFTWPTPYAKLDSDFYEVDCGEIVVDGYYNSAFDYSPFTKLILWLPYIGYQELNPDEFTGGSLRVKYHIDCITGACTALVSTGVVSPVGPQLMQILAQYTGNCGVQVPTCRVSYDGAISNAINILTTMASMGAGAAVGGAVEAASGADVAANAASQLTSATMQGVAGMKPSVLRNGTPGSTSGYMGVQKPYLIKTLPRQVRPSNYRELEGYPAYIGGTLSDFSGYTEVYDIQLTNISTTVSSYPATETELDEIISILKGGVIK